MTTEFAGRRRADEMFRAGDTVAGYVIDAPVGRGGSSDVYRVHRPGSVVPVAWKVMRPEVVDRQVVRERFRREFDFAALFDQPHIVRMEDRGTVTVTATAGGGTVLLPWLSMQYLYGGPATELIPPPQREPDVARIIPVASRIAAALDVVHAGGVVHRDVKPANILIDAPSSAVLIDFGIAQFAGAEREAARTGMIRGTIGYAAPEVVTGQPLTGATDEYAFACSLFELLTGTLPYRGRTVTATMRALLREPVPPITSRRKWLPSSLNSVFTKALAKEPSRRYDSCVEFVEIVGRTLRGVPVPGDRR